MPDIPTLWNEILARTVRQGACLIWQGTLNHKGYGRARLRNKGMEFVHRVVYELHTGIKPPVVMHSCDVRACVNPDHLKAGTHQLNVQDRDAKGRQAKVLSDYQVQRILRYGKYATYREIAKEYGVDHTRIFQILKFGGRRVKR